MNEERAYDYRHTSGPRVHHDYLIPALEKLLPESEGWEQPSLSFAGRVPFLWKSMLATCNR